MSDLPRVLEKVTSQLLRLSEFSLCPLSQDWIIEAIAGLWIRNEELYFQHLDLLDA